MSTYGVPAEPQPDDILSQNIRSTHSQDDARLQTQGTCWSKCMQRVKDHDEKLVSNWKEDMDNLLVFAGLLSAVLAAFIMEAFKLLQQDTGAVGNELLLQISQQVSSFRINNGYINSTLLSSVAPGAPFDPPAEAIVINVMWFASLVCSLSAASVAIIIKQWLHQYADWPLDSPRDSLQLRQLRWMGLSKWGFRRFIDSLSLLLEAALGLFFVGLLVFVWTLNCALAVVVTLLTAVHIIVIILTTVLPVLYVDCPYKSPQSWGLYRLLQISLNKTRRPWRFIIRRLKVGLYPVFKFRVPLSDKDFRVGTVHSYSWSERERSSIDYASRARLEKSLLVWADTAFADDQFLHNVITPCLLDMPEHVATKCVSIILKARVPALSVSSPDDTSFTSLKSAMPLLQLFSGKDIPANERAHTVAILLFRDLKRISASEINILQRYLNTLCAALRGRGASDTSRARAFERIFAFVLEEPQTVLALLSRFELQDLVSELRKREPQISVFDLMDNSANEALVGYTASLLNTTFDQNNFALSLKCCVMIVALRVKAPDLIARDLWQLVQERLCDLIQALPDRSLFFIKSPKYRLYSMLATIAAGSPTSIDGSLLNMLHADFQTWNEKSMGQETDWNPESLSFLKLISPLVQPADNVIFGDIVQILSKHTATGSETYYLLRRVMRWMENHYSQEEDAGYPFWSTLDAMMLHVALSPLHHEGKTEE